MTRKKKNPSDRFWEKVDKSGDCWVWLASKNTKGYGKFSSNGVPVMAHRFSWEQVNGEIPRELVVNHLCENKPCVRPDHLELITNAENLRYSGVGQKNAEHHKSKTHCRNGHEYTKETTRQTFRKNRISISRRCMVCFIATQERYNNKKRS